MAGAGAGWATAGLALVFLAAAAASLAQLLAPGRSVAATYLTSREADAVHLYMNAAMALMYAPVYDARAATLLVAVFAVAAAVLAVRLALAIRSRARDPRAARARIAGRAYHLLSTGAMLYAVWRAPMSVGHAAAMPHMGAMAGPSAAAGLLAALFGLDALLTGATPLFFPRAWSRILAQTMEADPNAADAARALDGRDPRTLALVIAPHVLMDLGMAAMLVGWPPM